MTSVLVYIVALYAALEVLLYCLRRWFPAPRDDYLRFAYSRYTMFTLAPGPFRFTMRNHNYNLPGNADRVCEFRIQESGYLDAIRPARVVISGGSTAFGLGCTSGTTNISGFLRQRHGVDAVNLATPGYIIEQEVIALLKYLDVVNPEVVIFVSGVNNLGLSLPFDYHAVPSSPDPNKFWNEEAYREAIDKLFFGVRDPWVEALAILKYLARHLLVARAYRRLRDWANPGAVRSVSVESPERLIAQATANYLKWLRLGAELCRIHGARLVLALQPYYCYGRDYSAIPAAGYKYKQNRVFDDFMLLGYEQLDAALKAESGIEYVPLHKHFAKCDVNVFADAVHLNDDGAQFAAEILNSGAIARLTRQKAARHS